MFDIIEIAQTAKVRLYTNDMAEALFLKTAKIYAEACNYASEYAFRNNCMTEPTVMHNAMYRDIRTRYGTRSQMTCSVFKTVAARYKTLETQIKDQPYKVVAEEDGKKKAYTFQRDLSWLEKPIQFSRPQVDLVKGRDYSFVNGKNEEKLLSINTVEGRIRVRYTTKAFEHLFCDGWTLGTAKLVRQNGIWYLLIGCTKSVPATQTEKIEHISGNDRGLRFLVTSFDDSGKTIFFDGTEIQRKRDKFDRTRASLQSKGTKGARRVLARISGRENRWMSDVNHCIAKALSERFCEPTLIVLEDLKDISFDEQNFHSKKQTHDLRSWAFYDLEQKIRYRAEEQGHIVLIVPAQYTSQRCPICGQIRKANRKHDRHEYKCSKCGYTSNDDRIAAMNLYDLGAAWLEDPETIPYFEKPVAKKKAAIM